MKEILKKGKKGLIVILIIVSTIIITLGFQSNQSIGGTVPGDPEIRGVATMASTTVGTTSTLIFATTTSNMLNRTIVNDGTTNVYLGIGSEAVSGKGIRLNANGGSYEINNNNLFTGAIYGISSTNVNITTLEK